jgi:hypothetical protein
MKKKTVAIQGEAGLFVDLTIHNISAFLLTEFVEKIVRPHYSANMSDALKDLMRNAIREENFVRHHIKAVQRGDLG